MKIAITFIFVIHGLIHFMGFAKAFDYDNMAEFTEEISKPTGVFWLLTGLLFAASAILFMLKKRRLVDTRHRCGRGIANLDFYGWDRCQIRDNCQCLYTAGRRNRFCIESF